MPAFCSPIYLKVNVANYFSVWYIFSLLIYLKDLVMH